MRCDICNKVLSEPEYNRDHQRWDPCQECLDVIQDTLAAFIDRPSIAEDESGFGFDSPITDLTIYLDNNHQAW